MGALMLFKYLQPKGKTLTSKSEAKSEQSLDKMAERESKAKAEGKAMQNDPTTLETPCLKQIPDSKNQLVTLGCSLFEAAGLDMVQHGVAGQTVGA